MKFFRFLILLVVLSAVLVFPKPSQAGCCVCGDLNAEFQCYDNVQNCSLCVKPQWSFLSTSCESIGCGQKQNLDKCCVFTGKVDGIVKKCTAVADSSACKVGEFEVDRKEFIAQSCDVLVQCSVIGTKYTAPEKASDVIFKPQVTLPGSKFIAGQSITVSGNTLGEYIAAFYAFFVIAIAILAAVMIMYGGIKWLVAGGNRGQVQNAKEQISSALIGLMIAFCAYLLLLIVSPRLVKFSSLNLIFVKPSEQIINKQEIAYGSKGLPISTATLTEGWYNDVKAKYDSFVTSAASQYGVNANLIYAIMYIESGGTPNASSPAGACGLMQLLPGTASQIMNSGVTCSQLYDPEFSIYAGAAYLKKLITETCPVKAMKKDQSVVSCNASAAKCINGDLKYVFAAYNGGQGANCSSVDCPGMTWWECKKNTGYAETRNYVSKAQAALSEINSY